MGTNRKRGISGRLLVPIVLALVAVAGVAETSVRDLSGPAGMLAFVAHASDPLVSVIDLDTLEVIDTLVLPDLLGNEQAHFLSVSPNGRYLWIAEQISTDGGYVQVIDLRTRAQVRRWEVGAGVGNHMTRDGRYVFTSSVRTNRINVFDATNLEYLGDFAVGAAPHVIDTSPDGKILWTTDAGGGNLLSFDISALPRTLPTALDRIPIGGRLHALAAHPNGRYVFVGSSESGDNVVDVRSKSVIARVPGAPHNYEISPEADYLLSGEIEFSADCGEPKVLGQGPRAAKGPLLRFVSIASLADPDRSDPLSVGTEKWLDAGGLTPSSISHHMYDPDGGLLMITVYLHQGVSPKRDGALVFVDPLTLGVERVLHLPPRPHAIAIAGHQR